MLIFFKKLIPKKLLVLIRPIYHFIIVFLAALYYRFPSNKLIVIGVTGTAGKTSTVYLIAKTLKKAGYKVGYTSTTIFSDGEKEELNNKKMTMPGRFFIQRSLRRMLNNKCQYAIIETTSEGIKQFRHRFINYDIVLFTNLYPEHIESHGSYEKYKEAKGKLFSYLSTCSVKYVDEHKRVVSPKKEIEKLKLERIKKTIIVNGDDKEAGYFLNFPSEIKIVYSLYKDDLDHYRNLVDTDNNTKEWMLIKGDKVHNTVQGVEMEINNQLIHLNILGSFNAYNVLAVYSISYSQGIDFDIIKKGLESVTGLVGKLERIDLGQDYIVIVDYSFEPKALEKLYETIQVIPHNNIIHLLGSTGGGRDKSRRRILGNIAGEKADYVVISNEDPYDEDPQDIINQVAEGAKEKGKLINHNLFTILDREEGIKKAIDLAHKDDLVILTGKGAEQFICIANGNKIPWDEREVVKKVIGDKLCIDKTKNL